MQLALESIDESIETLLSLWLGSATGTMLHGAPVKLKTQFLDKAILDAHLRPRDEEALRDQLHAALFFLTVGEKLLANFSRKPDNRFSEFQRRTRAPRLTALACQMAAKLERNTCELCRAQRDGFDPVLLR